MNNTPTREAVITNRATELPIIDLDPATLAIDADGYADPFEDALISFLDMGFTYARMVPWLEIAVTWSGARLGAPLTVQAMCPSCDSVFNVEDGVLIIMQDEGVVACADCESADDNEYDAEIEW